MRKVVSKIILEKLKFTWPLLILLLVIIGLFINSYLKEAVTFHFVDEFNNIIAGYFMLKGAPLYSHIFFNHQMLMADVSYLLQVFFHPNTLYKLILIHRYFIIGVSVLFDILLCLRFGRKTIVFILLFESVKYYLFGNLFLAEGIVVYPLVYLFGLITEKLEKKTLSPLDYLVSAFFCWLIIFMREPFIPLALFLYVLLLWKRNFGKWQLISLGGLLVLSLVTLVSVDMKEYFYQVVTVNFATIIPSDVARTSTSHLGLVNIFFYPITILFTGQWSYFKVILTALDVVFLFQLGLLIYLKKYRYCLLIFVVLGLANLRVIDVGTIFYAAFHLIPWYGLFTFMIATNSYMIWTSATVRRGWKFVFILALAVIFTFVLVYPKSFLWEKVDKQQQFDSNYSAYYLNGEIIRRLSNANDTLFVDMWDTLVYWQANLKDPYPYSIYLPVQTSIKTYSEARTLMFKQSPPNFYYTDCNGSLSSPLLTKEEKSLYSQLYYAGKPVCVYIKKTKIKAIMPEQWLDIKKLGYYLP